MSGEMPEQDASFAQYLGVRTEELEPAWFESLTGLVRAMGGSAAAADPEVRVRRRERDRQSSEAAPQG